MVSPAHAAPVKNWSVAGMVGDWIRQGTEGFIATQKILLDVAAQQNALALTIARERMGLMSPAPSKATVDLASQAIHNFIGAQQTLLDIASKQNDIIADGLKPGWEHTPVEGLAEVVHQGLTNCISAQKHFLKFVENESEGAVIDYGDGKSFDTHRLSDVAREGVRRFVESQKKFLDIVEHELTDKTAGSKKGKEKQPVKLFEMAKESVDAYVEAQKRLLDIASDQVDVNVKFVREVFNADSQKGRTQTSLPDVLKKSADSFVAAQKALVELASKPRKEAEKASSHKTSGTPEAATANA